MLKDSKDGGGEIHCKKMEHYIILLQSYGYEVFT